VNQVFSVVDKNHDGGIDFNELVDYTHSNNPEGRWLRDKVKYALATAPARRGMTASSSCTNFNTSQESWRSSDSGRGMRRTNSAILGRCIVEAV
jgi:hypothetical protein